MKATVTVTLEVETNLDLRTLDDRVENFIDPARLEAELLGGERVRVKRTMIEVTKG